MAKSIRKRVVEAVVAKLNAVTVAGGYQSDIAPDGAREARFGLPKLGERGFALLVAAPAEEPIRRENHWIREGLTLDIRIEVEQDPRGGETSMLEVLDPYMTDVHSVMVTDHTLGGLVDEVQPLGWNFDGAPEGRVAVDMLFRLDYRHQYKDVTSGTA